MPDLGNKRLTDYAACAGWAAKLPPGELAQVLRQSVISDDERLLVGPESFDDAGVVRLGTAEGLSANDRLALVQTVDFFPPVVDDPGLYGEIAAANSLSDVYAMGGKPFSALGLAGFPRGFPDEWRLEILRGGSRKVREAGAVLAGGHTVESDVQFGYSITGLIHPDKVRSNAGAQAGDVAYLTKPLGMGVMTTAGKFEKIPWEEVERAARLMATLNDRAAEAMNEAEAHACTDITGFGLIGHSLNIARSSELTFRIDTASVPIFPGALELAEAGHFSGGRKRGIQTFGDEVESVGGLEDARTGIFFDAETSGGLLIVLPEERADTLEDALRARDLPVRPVGRFVARESRPIVLA